MYKVFRMNTKFFSKIAVGLFVITVIVIGFISAVDKDQTVSIEENRTLKSKPKFSISSLMSGDYTKEFDEYYSDNFPNRNNLMKFSKKLNKFLFQFSAGEDDIVIINRDTDENDFGGESLLDDNEWMKSNE